MFDNLRDLHDAVNTSAQGFDKQKFIARFGDKTIRTGISLPDSPGIRIGEVSIVGEYERLNGLITNAQEAGDTSGYARAVYDLALFVGKEMGMTRKGGGDMGNTDQEAARVLYQTPLNDEVMTKLGNGEDWVMVADTFTNNPMVIHASGDPGQVILSKGFAGGTADEINFRGCSFVTAKVAQGVDTSNVYGTRKRHSPSVVEIHLKGFKQPENAFEVKMQTGDFDWDAHKISE
ncbi:hypothetical protein KBC75_01280 [Candidatus Shapirobacteria bacterium]|nr:hypothetical protein [Candidatus Shapirobacteria bacterium]